MAQAKLERRNYTAAFETLGKKGHLKRVDRGGRGAFWGRAWYAIIPLSSGSTTQLLTKLQIVVLVAE